MKQRLIALLVLTASLFIGACSGSKEEAPPPKKTETPVEKPKVVTPTRTYSIDDRYYIKGASLAPPTKISEPIQALNVIQVAPGPNEVLVLFMSHDAVENENQARYETWVGIELPSFAPGTHDLSKAIRAQYFRFVLAQDGLRYDGQKISGTLTIDGFEESYLTGSIDMNIEGESRSFTKSSEKFSSKFQGTFRIADVPIDVTRMK